MTSKLPRRNTTQMRAPALSFGAPARPHQHHQAPQATKVLLKPIPPKPTSQNDPESEPISDFPSPPVQIVTCKHGQQDEMIALPQLATAPPGELSQLTFQKLKQCNRICDFSDPSAEVVSKATKAATLNELIDCYSNPKMFSRLNRECHQQVIEMFSVNVFRPPPNVPRALMISDEVTIEDTAWPHLKLVYILFLKFLECKVDLRILQFQLTPKFIANLFAVLDFPDDRERVQAKAVIAAIFNKVPPQRPLLRITTTNLLMSVPEGLEMNAASHLLELFHLFTANEPLPLSPPLVTAFERVLMPLHLPCRCQRYFGPLVRCVLSLIRKDVRLGNSLLQFLITHWPLTLDRKSGLFIDEVAQMLDETTTEYLDQNICDLMACVAIAAESPSMTLANKALSFMMNNSIQNLIVNDARSLLSIIFPALYRVAKEHWHKSVQCKALEVMNTLMELSPEAFKTAAEAFRQKSMVEKVRQAKKKIFWDAVAQVAVRKDATIDTGPIGNDLTAFFGFGKVLPGAKRLMMAKRGSQPLIEPRRLSAVFDQNMNLSGGGVKQSAAVPSCHRRTASGIPKPTEISTAALDDAGLPMSIISEGVSPTVTETIMEEEAIAPIMESIIEKSPEIPIAQTVENNHGEEEDTFGEMPLLASFG